ncbi:ankyrin repeat-containing domain protein [Tuber brumale]|nr:ankyrin repeat-containing domain protein [Tuber brumale]
MTDGLGLGDAYGATLSRIKGQGGEKSRLGMAALMWISNSERPLKADELCHALAVEIGSPNLDADNVPSIGTLLSCCQGLVAVDREASTVRLIHFTVQEYLRAHPELSGTAHSTMAETCLSYLNSQKVKAFSTSPSPNLQDTPFLEYSSLYWGVHAKKDLSDCAKLLALKLFDDYNNHISIKLLLKAHQLYHIFGNFNEVSQFSGLHCASFFGIVEIVASLVEVEGCDINQKDCVGNTPLLWAARNGHEGAVRILLERGDVNPDKPGSSGRTPLWWAAWDGHEGVVKMLLGRDDLNPDKPDNHSETPLRQAASNGHEGGVVKMLLGRDDVNPDKPDNDGRTPLWSATERGHAQLVVLLQPQASATPNTT